MEKNVQLKEEEIVGQETVLSDIYPRTSTSSVEDETTGENMDVVLGRIYEMIHDKLTRNVNSVNGRAGAVVLTSKDVGLNNVDNISFDDIKTWSLEAIDDAFANRNFLYFSTMDRLHDTLAVYVPSEHNNMSYFINKKSEYDKRPIIGRIKFDDSSGEPIISDRELNTVEDTNDGLTYDNGILNLKLADGQVGLEITSTGLRIDATALKRGVQMYETFYTMDNSQEEQSSDASIIEQSGGFLLDDVDGPIDGNGGLLSRIYIGNRLIQTASGSSNFYVHPDYEEIIEPNNLIIISGPPSTNVRTDMFDDNHFTPSLKYSGPLIGYMEIEQDPSDNDIRVFHFVPFSPMVGYGLMDPVSYPWEGNYNFQNAISVNLLIDEDFDKTVPGANNDTRVSYSNLQAVSSSYAPYDTTVDENPTRVSVDLVNENKTMNYIMTPEGRKNMFHVAQESNNNMRKGGMFVPTDSSLCAIPYSKYGYDVTSEEGDEQSSAYQNYFASTPYYLDEVTVNNHPGFMNSPTFLGINLLKGTYSNGGSKAAIPLSGLRIVDPGKDFGKHEFGISWELLGLNYDADHERVLHHIYEHTGEKVKPIDDSPISIDLSELELSGGLMVNVGKGLEILPEGIADNGVTYARMGKVSVRIGEGLDFDKYNRLVVTGGGGDSGVGLMNASQLSIQSNNIKDAILPVTEENKARLDYEATTFHDPYLYGDNNVFTQTIIELGEGLAFEATRNDFIEAMLKRGTIKQIIESEIFGTSEQLKNSTWNTLTQAILDPASTIFTSSNPDNVEKLNIFRTYVQLNPYDSTNIEASQSPSTLLMDWIRHNPEEGYETGANRSISELITAYESAHPQSPQENDEQVNEG